MHISSLYVAYFFLLFSASELFIILLLLNKSLLTRIDWTLNLLIKISLKFYCMETSWAFKFLVYLSQLDKIVLACSVPIKRSQDYATYYDLVLKSFKQTCADMGYLKESKASLEDCIIGLRDALKSDTQLELKVSHTSAYILVKNLGKSNMNQSCILSETMMFNC